MMMLSLLFITFVTAAPSMKLIRQKLENSLKGFQIDHHSMMLSTNQMNERMGGKDWRVSSEINMKTGLRLFDNKN